MLRPQLPLVTGFVTGMTSFHLVFTDTVTLLRVQGRDGYPLSLRPRNLARHPFLPTLTNAF
jgi:hypothetical protein